MKLSQIVRVAFLSSLALPGLALLCMLVQWQDFTFPELAWRRASQLVLLAAVSLTASETTAIILVYALQTFGRLSSVWLVTLAAVVGGIPGYLLHWLAHEPADVIGIYTATGVASALIVSVCFCFLTRLPFSAASGTAQQVTPADVTKRAWQALRRG